jgi:hypothetical protein
MAMFGCDFAFENADIQFKNMDLLIVLRLSSRCCCSAAMTVIDTILQEYINARQSRFGFNLFYSTPGNYTNAVHAQNKTWSVKAVPLPIRRHTYLR